MQKKVEIDEGVVELVKTMDDLLSFVEDVGVLQNKLTRFSKTIADALRAIEECSTSIRTYVNTALPGEGFYGKLISIRVLIILPLFDKVKVGMCTPTLGKYAILKNNFGS